MTANDIFTISAAYLSQSTEDSEDLQPFVLPWLNLLLQELLPTENMLRRADGQTELTAAPLLTALTDTVDYHDVLTRLALPYGLAADFYRDDGNKYQQQLFRAMYADAVTGAQAGGAKNITDVYTSDSE